MKVKIGNRIIDSNDEPIMLIFESDKERVSISSQILDMVESDTVRKYVQFPNSMTADEIVQFMKI